VIKKKNRSGQPVSGEDQISASSGGEKKKMPQKEDIVADLPA